VLVVHSMWLPEWMRAAGLPEEARAVARCGHPAGARVTATEVAARHHTRSTALVDGLASERLRTETMPATSPPTAAWHAHRISTRHPRLPSAGAGNDRHTGSETNHHHRPQGEQVHVQTPGGVRLLTVVDVTATAEPSSARSGGRCEA
jgi:hypothetical protein